MSVPYLPLYVADYEADTAHLSLEEDGAYNRLLRLCWRTPGCSLPNDSDWIAKRLRISDDDYRRVIAPIIDEFFSVSHGRIVSRRLSAEREKIDAISRARSEAGKRGGRPKTLKNHDNNKSKGGSKTKANGKHLEPELEPDIPVSGFANAQPSTGVVSPVPSGDPAPDPQPATSEKKARGAAPAGSDEDRFWAGVTALEAKGVSRAMSVKALRAVEGNFTRALSILLDTARARQPQRYLGAIIRDLGKTDAASDGGAVPAWIVDARAQGYPVTQEGRWWRMSGALYDDEGEQIGN